MGHGARRCRAQVAVVAALTLMWLAPLIKALCYPPCYNGGTCLNSNRCACPKGYMGARCTIALCREGCVNGGRCAAPGVCTCRDGYSGLRCDKPKCDVPCRHGAVCVAPDTCECKHGSHGRYCEKFKCRSKCLNGGACVGPNRCKCPPNYGGAQCHKALCPSPCKNGGRCSDGRCICPAGFQGQTCEKRQCVMSTISQSFRRGYSQLSKHRVAVSCGPWRPRHACYQLKKSYTMIYRTFYRTVYVCGKDHFSADTNI
ncbi:wnt inhibitory factor 1-like [Lethenteron reissneri]|uniref:wnt inhibitory factor 1-like n=1 Tax=Lethenteron reissneri TaxID=7753 RepID=UPI002AB62964|nr:wnt inhibitory factor 1-like [Lethenteron reissneri]